MCFGKKNNSNNAVSQSVLPAAQGVAAQPVSSATNVKTAVVNNDASRTSDANIHQDNSVKDGPDPSISNSDNVSGTTTVVPKKRKNIVGLDL